MADPIKTSQFPFLTRKMLNFEHGTEFMLRIMSHSDKVGTLYVHGITREGAFGYVHNTSMVGALGFSEHKIPDIPILLSITDTDSNFIQGSNFVTVNLAANGENIHELCAGSVYSVKSISWPTTNSVNARPGGGKLESVTGTDQAAGDEIAELVPTVETWKIIAIRFQLVADANAANRRVHLTFTDTGDTFLDAFSDIDQTAGETRNYTFAPFGTIPDRLDDDDILCCIPNNLLLGEGWEIETQTTNLQVGDNFGEPTIIVEKFFSPS